VARFLVDESCDFAVVRALRSAGHNVAAIVERARGTPDEAVTDMAVREGRILITEDTDFGRLVYAHAHPSGGVIMIRFPAGVRGDLGTQVVRFVDLYGGSLIGSFAVLQPGRARISRPISRQG
jgi:predicted nuclease of predicted toxin-antitoxin system